MIVGTKIIPVDRLINACSSVSALRAYSLALVPKSAQHIDAIVDNQKYLVAIEVRNLQSLPYKTKKMLCEGLLENTVIRGTINTLVDIEDLLSSIDIDAFYKSLFKEELKHVSS